MRNFTYVCNFLKRVLPSLKDYKHFQSCLSLSKLLSVIKFIYSKKASKFCKITTLLLFYAKQIIMSSILPKKHLPRANFFVHFLEEWNARKMSFDILWNFLTSNTLPKISSCNENSTTWDYLPYPQKLKGCIIITQRRRKKNLS